MTSAARRAAISFCDGFARRHQHLAAHVAALLDGGELVFEVHAGGAGFDHGLHQFEGVQHAAEAGFGVGDDRGEVVDIVALPSMCWIWSQRWKVLLMRLTTSGTLSSPGTATGPGTSRRRRWRRPRPASRTGRWPSGRP
jgi:hypothetical protein